jgi:hypothetical protein
MRRSYQWFLAGALLATASCSSDQLAPDRTLKPALTGPSSAALQCPTDPGSTVDSLLPQLFKPGAGRRGTAQGYDNDIDKALHFGDQASAELYADSLINFTLQEYFSGDLIGGQSAETQQRIELFFTALYCSIGLVPIDFSTLLLAENTKFIRFNSPITEVSADSAAVLVKTGDVPTTVYGTFVSVYKTTNPLPTSLDWYGADGFKLGAYEFVSNPEVTFVNPVLVGVCVKYDNAVVSPTDLRLAHAVAQGSAPTPNTTNYVVTTAGGTIEIGAYADPSPLGLVNGQCPALPAPPSAYRGLLGRLRQFARAILPAQLYAGVSGGSSGTQVAKFSPFAAVDTKLSLSSTGPSSPQYIPLGSTTTTADVTATVVARYDEYYGNVPTPIDGVQVDFAPGAAFAPSSATTGTDGSVTSSWTLVAGTNTATGTPSFGGLVFDPSVANYSVNVVQETTLNFTGPTPPSGVQGTSYSHTFVATGGRGAGNYSWSLTAAPGQTLPSGLGIGSVTGVLAWPSPTAGSYGIDVTVTSGAQSVTQRFTVTITLPPITSITPTSFTAIAGASFSGSLTAAGGGGAGTYSWGGSFGSDPFVISPAGKITNTVVLVAGSSYTLPVQVTSGSGATAVTGSANITVTVVNPSAIWLSFSTAPSKQNCYAVDQPMNPVIVVEVRNGSGGALLSGVTVSLHGETNNGNWVTVTPDQVTSVGGYATFDDPSFPGIAGPTINKTGGYALVASTTSPFAASVKSAKFTISPSCS